MANAFGETLLSFHWRVTQVTIFLKDPRGWRNPFGTPKSTVFTVSFFDAWWKKIRPIGWDDERKLSISCDVSWIFPYITFPETNSSQLLFRRPSWKETHRNQPQCFRCELFVLGRVAIYQLVSSRFLKHQLFHFFFSLATHGIVLRPSEFPCNANPQHLQHGYSTTIRDPRQLNSPKQNIHPGAPQNANHQEWHK